MANSKNNARFQETEKRLISCALELMRVTRPEHLTVRAVCAAEEGEPLLECDAAVSVYIPRAGDGLWELSKRLKKPPEEVLKSNPELEFPIREGERVVIYRKKSLPVS